MAASSVTLNYVDIEKLDPTGNLIKRRYEEGYQGQIKLTRQNGEILFQKQFFTFEELFDFREENLHGYSGVSAFERSFTKIRTDTMSNYLGDMLIPTVVNHAMKVETLGYKILAVTLASAWDMLTMVPRGMNYFIGQERDVEEPTIPQCIHQDDPEKEKVLTDEPLTMQINELIVKIDEELTRDPRNSFVTADIIKREYQYTILMNPSLSAPIQRISKVNEKKKHFEGTRDILTRETSFHTRRTQKNPQEIQSYSFFHGMLPAR